MKDNIIFTFSKNPINTEVLQPYLFNWLQVYDLESNTLVAITEASQGINITLPTIGRKYEIRVVAQPLSVDNRSTAMLLASRYLMQASENQKKLPPIKYFRFPTHNQLGESAIIKYSDIDISYGAWINSIRVPNEPIHPEPDSSFVFMYSFTPVQLYLIETNALQTAVSVDTSNAMVYSKFDNPMASYFIVRV